MQEGREYRMQRRAAEGMQDHLQQCLQKWQEEGLQDSLQGAVHPLVQT